MLPPGTQLGPYEILAHIGSGGMGEVYRARDSRLGRTVALKVLPETLSSSGASDRFEREARAASSLSHPNICHVYMLGGTADGRQFIAMEYVDGETLRQRLATGRLPVREALEFGIQIASALVASHAAGVVHRDVKPENVIVTSDGFIKVLDFGLARFHAPFGPEVESTRTLSQTDAGKVVGTFAYMSPEQARGQNVDPRTDIWSLSVVLFEMVAGRAPFSGPSSSDIVAAILDREPPPLVTIDPTYPSELQRIISKGLRKNREERYQTAKDLLIDLKTLQDSLPSADRPKATVHDKTASAKGHRIVVAGLLALLVIVSVGWFAFRQFSRRTPKPIAQPLQSKQLTIAPGWNTDPAVSRDGRLLTFTSDQAGDDLELWVQHIAGGDALRLTANPADDYEPTFSADGTRIFFRSDRGEGGIYSVSALGGPEQLLVLRGRTPKVSPDGRLVTYWVGRPGSGAPASQGASQIFIIEAGGGTPRQLASTFAAARFPVWSPDGGYVLFLGTREANKQSDWCLAGVRTDETVCLDVGKVIGENGQLFEFHAATDWANDTALYYTRHDTVLGLARIRLDVAAKRLIGEPEQLISGPVDVHSAVFGPSGEIVFADTRSTMDIWSISVDQRTGELRGPEVQITNDPALDIQVSASKTQPKLVYVSNRARTPFDDVWLRDLQTGKERQVSSGHTAWWPSLDPLGERVAYLSITRGEPRQLHVVDLRTGRNETVCTKGCGSAGPTWSPEGAYVITTNGDVIRSISPSTRKIVEMVRRPPYKLWTQSISPDNRSLLFSVRHDETHGKIIVAPFKPNEIVSEDEWVTVSDEGSEDKPNWSADGRIIYFTSERDGFRCIWARRFDPLTRRPIGSVFPAYHSHKARRSLKDVGLTPLGISVTRDHVFFNQAEKLGNIWMMTRTQ